MTDKPQQPEDQKSDDPQSEGPAEPDSPDSGRSKQDPTAAKSETATAADVDGMDKSANKAAGGAKPPRVDRRSPAKKAANWSAFVLVLVLLAGIGGLSYYQWLHQQRFEETVAGISEQLEQQSSRLNEVSRSVDEVSRSVDSVQEEAEQALQRMSQLSEQRQQQAQQLEQQIEEQTQQLEQQVSGLRQQVQAISTTTTEDWKLAEAYYLTRLAGQRLLMERDTDSALALLQAADGIVRNYPDPDLYPVREALSDDIAALRLADSVDREGLYLRIGALSRQISELEVAEPLNYRPEQEETATETEPAPVQVAEESRSIWESIKHSFSRAMSKLQGFIRIRQHDEAPRPLADPERQLYLRSSLQTALDTAQLALLREQPTIYQASLEKAQNLLDDLYAESTARENTMAELSRLQNTDIVQELPDISDSQEALGRYLERRHRLAPQNGEASRDETREGQQ